MAGLIYPLRPAPAHLSLSFSLPPIYPELEVSYLLDHQAHLGGAALRPAFIPIETWLSCACASLSISRLLALPLLYPSLSLFLPFSHPPSLSCSLSLSFASNITKFSVMSNLAWCVMHDAWRYMSIYVVDVMLPTAIETHSWTSMFLIT